MRNAMNQKYEIASGYGNRAINITTDLSGRTVIFTWACALTKLAKFGA